jgi:hypothetical protein
MMVSPKSVLGSTPPLAPAVIVPSKSYEPGKQFSLKWIKLVYHQCFTPFNEIIKMIKSLEFGNKLIRHVIRRKDNKTCPHVQEGANASKCTETIVYLIYDKEPIAQRPRKRATYWQLQVDNVVIIPDVSVLTEEQSAQMLQNKQEELAE